VFSFFGPKVYLEINEESLFIGRLKTKKGYFYCDRFQDWPLTAFEVKDGVIFKPSVLYLLIKSFLTDYNLQGAKAVVCCPYLTHWKGVDKRMPFFQSALYVSKSGLKIYAMLGEGILSDHDGVDGKRFFHKDKLKGRFDFFCHFRLKNKKKILIWLAGSAIMFIFVGTVLSFIHVTTYKQKSALLGDRLSLEQDLDKLQKAVKSFSAYKAANKNLKKELHRFESSKNEKWPVVTLLSSVSEIIPPNTWLEKISCSQIPSKGKKLVDKKLVTIKGASKNYQEVLDFYRDIVARQILDDCSLKYKHATDIFSFTIKAKLNG